MVTGMKKLFTAFLGAALLLAPLAAQAQEGTAKRILSTGTVAANRSVTLSAKIMGRVEKITRDEGEGIAAGGLLLSIEDTELKAGVMSAEAQLAQATADAAYKKKLEEKMRTLFAQNSISEDAVDQAALEASVSEARVRMAEAALVNARQLLSESKIVAPFDAVVISKSAEVGQMTAPGQPLFVLEDQSRLKFRTSVKERDVPFIKVGQKATVTIDALADAVLNGKVVRIVPSGDETTHSFTVEIALPKARGLYPGMFGKAEF